MRIAAIVLAAGQGRRFGQDKRQVLLPDGRSMLDTVLSLYAPLFEPLLVVVAPGDSFAPALAARHGAQVVECAQAAAGMGHSLAAGAQALLEVGTGASQGLSAVQGAVIALADMPAVSPPTLLALRAALLQHGQPVVPVHDGRLGHPRGLPRACFEAMTHLQGDMGARHLLDWGQAIKLPVNDPGVLLDVDQPADLAHWRAL
jgi:molybdenum cofactor cytidylyltransferase